MEIDNAFTKVDTKYNFDFEFYNTMFYGRFVMPETIQDDIQRTVSEQKQQGLNFLISYKPDDVCCKTDTKLHDQVMDALGEKMTTNNRFLQRFYLPNVFQKNVCEWIITETENVASVSGWTTTRHVAYPTTDIPVERIHAIFPFVLSSLADIFKEIDTAYCLNSKIKFDIKDLFIVKYSHTQQNYLEEHTDGSFFTVNILLSDPTEFEGGGTQFEDGITYKLKQGCGICHFGKSKHEGLPVTRGTRYLLVVFIGIIYEHP